MVEWMFTWVTAGSMPPGVQCGSGNLPLSCVWQGPASEPVTWPGSWRTTSARYAALCCGGCVVSRVAAGRALADCCVACEDECCIATGKGGPELELEMLVQPATASAAAVKVAATAVERLPRTCIRQ